VSDFRPRLAAVVAALLLGLLPGAGAVPAAAQTASDSTYTVEDGDTLYRISRRFDVSVGDLQRWNDLTGTQIVPGQILRVRPPNRSVDAAPSPDASTDPPADADQQPEAAAPADTTGADPDTASAETAPADTTAVDTVAADSVSADTAIANAVAADTVAADTARTDTARTDTARTDTAEAETRRVPPTTPPPYGRHRAEAGDTFVSLALRYGTTADTLFALNDSLRTPLEAGSVLRLPRSLGPPTHVVQPDETLYSIAGTYGVSVRALRSTNAVADGDLSPGQRLQIPGRDGPAPAPPGEYAAPDTTGAVTAYPSTFEGRLTASGATYDPRTFVGSHPSLPYGSVVLLTRRSPRRSVFVRIVDRGPLEEAFLMDVSEAAAEQLGGPDPGNIPVELRVVWTK